MLHTHAHTRKWRPTSATRSENITQTRTDGKTAGKYRLQWEGRQLLTYNIVQGCETVKNRHTTHTQLHLYTYTHTRVHIPNNCILKHISNDTHILLPHTHPPTANTWTPTPTLCHEDTQTYHKFTQRTNMCTAITPKRTHHQRSISQIQYMHSLDKGISHHSTNVWHTKHNTTWKCHATHSTTWNVSMRCPQSAEANYSGHCTS